MSKIWFIITLMALSTIVAIGFGVFGDFNNFDIMAKIALIGICGLVASCFFLSRQLKLKDAIRNVSIWGVLFFCLMIVYNKRYELQDTISTLTAGIIPESPVTRVSEKGIIVTVDRSLNGHFAVNALINEQKIHMTIDTGAYSIVLTHEDAQRIGIDVSRLKFTLPISTANGSTFAAPTMINTIKIGNISRKNIQALVSMENNLSESLLGMNYLNRLSGYSVRGDRFSLID